MAVCMLSHQEEDQEPKQISMRHKKLSPNHELPFVCCVGGWGIGQIPYTTPNNGAPIGLEPPTKYLCKPGIDYWIKL